MRISRLLRVAGVMLAAISMMALALVPASAQDEMGPVTQGIMDRGEMICGVNQSLQGFGFVNDAGEFSGFDIDICRAVAAAVLGDANALTFRPLVASERQAAMQSGEIDMMSRNTTWTLSRDTEWGAIFGPTTFYDGQGVMTRSEFEDVSSIPQLDGSAMCVQAGTTTELNISDYVEARDLEIDIQVYPDANSTWEAYISGACDSWTTDKSGLASFRQSAEDPGAHKILGETISKEPLGPLSPQSDPQFAEIMHWVVFGLINAEEFGINSENIDEFLPEDGESDEDYVARVSPQVARLLGQGNNASGSYLGIPNDFMVTVIRQVGNYGEIYERNLTPLGLERADSPNALWTEGGLLYAPPFR
jgi:general L-amino acid transport system substrate-binding protein